MGIFNVHDYSHKNNNAIKVQIGDDIYPSIKDACKALNVNQGSFRKEIKEKKSYGGRPAKLIRPVKKYKNVRE